MLWSRVLAVEGLFVLSTEWGTPGSGAIRELRRRRGGCQVPGGGEDGTVRFGVSVMRGCSRAEDGSLLALVLWW